MPRTITMLALTLAFALAPFVAQARDQGRSGKVKVVYHLNRQGGEGDKADMHAHGNIISHIAAVGPGNAEVKVVMHDNGLGILKSATQNLKSKGEIADLETTRKAGFLVCNNTLAGRKIDPAKDLLEIF